MDDESSTEQKKKKDPKGAMSLIAPVIIIIVYSCIDYLHRFIFVQRPCDIDVKIEDISPLMNACVDMKVDNLKGDFSRKQFTAYADDMLLYVKKFKFAACQLMQDVLGLWSWYPINTPNVEFNRIRLLTDVDKKEWVYYLITNTCIISFFILVSVMITSLWEDFQKGLDQNLGVVYAFKYAYGRLSAMEKALLVGFYIVVNILVLKMCGRVVYRIFTFGSVFFIFMVLLIVLAVIVLGRYMSKKKEIANTVSRILEGLTSKTLEDSAIVERKNGSEWMVNNEPAIAVDKGGGAIQYILSSDIEKLNKDLAKGVQVILDSLSIIPQGKIGQNMLNLNEYKNMLGSLNDSLDSVKSAINKTLGQVFASVVEFFGISCGSGSSALERVPDYVFSSMLTNALDKAIKDNYPNEVEAELKKRAMEKIIKSCDNVKFGKHSWVTELWLFATDFTASLFNKNNKEAKENRYRCMYLGTSLRYNFKDSPLVSVVRFLLFEKKGTQFLFALIISILVINGVYELHGYLDINSFAVNASDWLFFREEEEEELSENNEEEGAHQNKPVKSLSILISLVIVSLFVTTLYILYIGVLTCMRNFVASTLTNWILEKFPNDESKLTTKHYILKEVVLYDHQFDTTIGMKRCDWKAQTVNVVLKALIAMCITMLFATFITWCYGHVHFTSLKKTDEEKSNLKIKHFIDVHKTIVISASTVVLFGLLYYSMRNDV